MQDRERVVLGKNYNGLSSPSYLIAERTPIRIAIIRAMTVIIMIPKVVGAAPPEDDEFPGTLTSPQPIVIRVFPPSLEDSMMLSSVMIHEAETSGEVEAHT